MTRTRHDHNQSQHGLLHCLPLLALISLSILLGPARADGENHTGPATREVTLSYLKRTLKALQDVMGFYKAQHTKVNLDGIIGMRMVEGALKVLLKNLEEREQTALLPEYILVDLRSLKDLTGEVADMTEPYVAFNEAQYYNQLWPTIAEGVWELNYPTRNLSSEVPTWNYDDQEFMMEMQSDQCISELFGTGKKGKEKCVLSDNCWGNMTNLGYHRYSLTHQIFYLQLAELGGCLYEVLVKIEESNGTQPSLLYLQDTFCLNILNEAKILANQSFPINSRDLFMEMGGLCGPYGFWEFFRYSWLDAILSWQDKEHGCYKNPNWPAYLKDKKRPKREEIRVDHDCLSHMSSVALMSLGQYTRYLTETLLPQNTSWHQLADHLDW